MKHILLFFSSLSSCSKPVRQLLSVEEQMPQQQQENQTRKRSDAFARDLQQ
jgi:hypothetical protein